MHARRPVRSWLVVSHTGTGAGTRTRFPRRLRRGLRLWAVHTGVEYTPVVRTSCPCHGAMFLALALARWLSLSARPTSLIPHPTPIPALFKLPLPSFLPHFETILYFFLRHSTQHRPDISETDAVSTVSVSTIIQTAPLATFRTQHLEYQAYPFGSQLRLHPSTISTDAPNNLTISVHTSGSRPWITTSVDISTPVKS